MKCILAALAVVFILAGSHTDINVQSFPRLENLPRFTMPDAPPRFHEGPVNEFIPMVYGEIFPFLGRVMNESGWLSIEKFGFVDAYGRIVCDPLFTEVTELTHGDNRAWVVSSRWIPQGTVIQDGHMHSFLVETEGFAGVISSDGSFFEKFDDVYTGAWLFPFDYEFIPVMRGGKWGLIDFYGNQVMDFLHPNAPLFSHGLAAVYRWAEHESLFHYMMHAEPFYYIDTDGNVVLGPFASPSYFDHGLTWLTHLEPVLFHDGLAMNFYGGDDETNRYGFIDTEGNIVIPRDFLLFTHSQLGWSETGLTLAALADTLETVNIRGWPHYMVNYALIDREGNIVAIMPQSHTHGVGKDGGFFTWHGHERDSHVTFDRCGNELPYEGWHMGNGYFQTVRLGEHWMVTEIRITGNGIDTTFSEYRLSWINHLFGDWVQVNLTFGHIWETRMMNLQTGEVRYFDNFVMWGRFPDRNVVNISDWDNPRFGVFNDAGEVVIDFVFDILRPIGDNYFAAQGRYGGLVGPGGEWIIRTRLTGNFD